jgi:hypothetical protein
MKEQYHLDHNNLKTRSGLKELNVVEIVKREGIINVDEV